MLSQFITEMVLKIVSTPQEKLTMDQMLYVPVAENKCVGVNNVEVLFTPLAGSPKFQTTLDIVASVMIENGILFSRHVSFEAIIPLQHNPINIVLQTVETGKPGS